MSPEVDFVFKENATRGGFPFLGFSTGQGKKTWGMFFPGGKRDKRHVFVVQCFFFLKITVPGFKLGTGATTRCFVL